MVIVKLLLEVLQAVWCTFFYCNPCFVKNEKLVSLETSSCFVNKEKRETKVVSNANLALDTL